MHWVNHAKWIGIEGSHTNSERKHFPRAKTHENLAVLEQAPSVKNASTSPSSQASAEQGLRPQAFLSISSLSYKLWGTGSCRELSLDVSVWQGPLVVCLGNKLSRGENVIHHSQPPISHGNSLLPCTPRTLKDIKLKYCSTVLYFLASF